MRVTIAWQQGKRTASLPVLGIAACIAQAGVVGCPSGSPYQQQRVYYADYVDSRACSASVVAPGCLSANPSILVTIEPPTGGTCKVTAGGSTPIGDVTARDPVTVCCK